MTKAADLSALGSNVTTAGNLSSNSTLTLQTNSTTAITVDSSQNVGIGTTSPNVKLDVIGSIEASAAATQDAIILAGRAGGTSSRAVTLTPTTLTASRTVTFPDADINFTTGLGVASGGTGQTTYTNGQLLIGNTTGNTLTKATLTAGSGVTITNGAGSITIASQSFVAGMIMLWSGSSASIPSGWLLCDGTNSTPDLRNRFVVGAGSTYAVNATGGSADAIVVSHTHTATSVVTDPGHRHGFGGAGGGGVLFVGTTVGTVDKFTQTATTGITVATTNVATGSSGTNANLPPYYALCYIMKS